MASITLILIDHKTSAELEQAAIPEEARFAIYEQCRDHELFQLNRKQFVVHRVFWVPDKAKLICAVAFHSWVTDACDCD